MAETAQAQAQAQAPAQAPEVGKWKNPRSMAAGGGLRARICCSSQWIP